MKKLTITTINYLRNGFEKDDITKEEFISNVLIYNENTLPIEDSSFNADGSLQALTRTVFDEKKRPVEVVQYDGDHELCEKLTNRYDENGHLVEQRQCYGEGMPEYMTRFVYENNLLMQQDCYDCDEDEAQFSYTEKKYSYDEKGQRIKEIEYDEDGNELYITVNQYGENGVLVSQTRDEIQLHDRRTYTFEYDERGNKIKDLIYNYDEALIAKIYTSYNEYNLPTQVEEEDLDHYRLTQYEYDGKNPIKMSVSDKQGNIITWSAYSYDSENHIVAQDNYVQDEVNPAECRLASRFEYTRE